MANKTHRAGRSGSGGVSLPVLRAGRAPIRKSKNGRRRAVVLIAVHAIFALHLAHWVTAGETVSPVEPSESMRTLELGQVNAGFVFFAAAILATLVFGRFFCGWGCHIVALQDLCAWLLKRVGVRPKVFRSRALVFVPLGLALYMFVWPTMKRVAIVPLVEGWWATARADLRVAPFPVEGFTNHLVTGDFWETFPGIAVAIPFLLVCGFGAVYFLGAKGFCTYGCPYGGVFGPLDRLSPGRIVVDDSKCHQCGHCTAVCTSNVRVHDEVREFGMVVDPGCMKCMDCVSVCPNGALSFGFARPSVVKGRARHATPARLYDTSRGEDVGLVVVFLVVFLSLRGAYDAVPMLMAGGLAGIACFLAWKAWRVWCDENVRAARVQLKHRGRLTGTGIGFVLAMALGAALVLHTGVVQFLRWRGDRVFERLAIPKQAVVTPGAPPLPSESTAAARAALADYARAAGVARGGIALFSSSSSELRRALLLLVVGDAPGAEASLRFVAGRSGAGDELTTDLARVLTLQGRHQEAENLLASTLAARPEFWSVREALAPLRLRAGFDLDAGPGRLPDPQPRALAGVVLKVWPYGPAPLSGARVRVILREILAKEASPPPRGAGG